MPRVKFTLKLLSYVLFLVLYFAFLSQHGEYWAEDPDTGVYSRASGGPHLAFTALDACFYTWAVSLWLEEMHQWAVDRARGMSHVSDLINILDVVSLFALLLAFVLRLFALGLCDGFGDEPDAGGGAPAGGGTPPLEAAADALLSGSDAAGRQLRGSSGNGWVGVDPMTHVAPHVAIWEATYHDCTLLYTSQVIVSLNAILFFFRLINYLTVWRALGVLYVILVQVSENVAVWLTLFAILLFGFSAASLGLMPSLGGGAWTPSGAFFLPWWAMYGEFGELSEVSAAGSAIGTCVLWTWAFCSQVLLVNILIAMMTETYEKVKKNADNEWRYTRVFLVDEFAGTVYDIPSPLSMPFLLLDFARVLSAKLHRSACYRCLRRCCGSGDDDSDDASAGAWSPLLPFARGGGGDLLTSSLKEEELAAISQAYPDRIMQADLLEEQELSAKGGLINQLIEHQDALDKVLAKELENQEIIMHIDKLHTEGRHVAHMKKVDSAKWGAPADSSNDMGEVRAQLKLAREQTLAVKQNAAEELTRLRGEAGAAERAVGKMQMEREMKDGMLAQQREQLGTLEAALRTAQTREEAPPRELQPDAPEAATRMYMTQAVVQPMPCLPGVAARAQPAARVPPRQGAHEAPGLPAALRGA